MLTIGYMKILSFFLTALFLGSISYFLLHLLSLYNKIKTLKAFGFSDKVVFQFMMPGLILTVVYLGAFSLAIYFNTQKKYLINILFLVTMTMAFFIIVWFLKLS
jgi:hypothetical protein